jgi:hypothetical protein
MVIYRDNNHPGIRFLVSPVVKLNLPEHASAKGVGKSFRAEKLGRFRHTQTGMVWYLLEAWPRMCVVDGSYLRHYWAKHRISTAMSLSDY